MSRVSRYHRQSILPLVGEEGQAALARSRAVVVGVGALGCASADLLARAGVGRITLIDRDVVELTNLQRQCLFTEADAREGLPKAEAARRRLAAVNSEIEIEARVADLTWRNAEELVGAGRTGAPEGSLVIVDGTDNYETRYVLNDLAVQRGVAYAYAGAVGTEGMAMLVLPQTAGWPCLRCVFPEPPPVEARRTCETSGVFGPAVSAIAAVQAGEALKMLMGRGENLTPTLTRMDLSRGVVSSVDLSGSRDPGCVCCGRRGFEFLDGRRGGDEAVRLCGRNAVQVGAAMSGSEPGWRVDLAAIEAKLRVVGEVTRSALLVRAALADGLRLTVFADGRAVVEGTTDAARARSVVAKFVGA